MPRVRANGHVRLSLTFVAARRAPARRAAVATSPSIRQLAALELGAHVKLIDFAGRSPAEKQGLLSQLVIPRPIAMITTVDEEGVLNVAPFSYFMPVSGEPPLVALPIAARHEASPPAKATWRTMGARSGRS